VEDEFSTRDSVDAYGSCEVNRGFRLVVSCLWVVNSKHDRRERNYTNPKNNDRPPQALHGMNPKLPRKVRLWVYFVNVNSPQCRVLTGFGWRR